jgi:hypothetical protein
MRPLTRFPLSTDFPVIFVMLTNLVSIQSRIAAFAAAARRARAARARMSVRGRETEFIC